MGGGGYPGSSIVDTPAKRNAHSLTWRQDAGDEEAHLEMIVKSTLVKLALTLGTLAAALLAGAANMKVG